MLRHGLLIVVCLFCQIPLSASILAFTTYGPGDTYDTRRGYTVGAGYTGGNLFMPFTTGPFYEVDLALAYAQGSHTVQVELAMDSGGAPGAVIESFSVNVNNTFGSPGAVVQVFSVLQPVLQAGTPYWLLATTDASSNDPWYYSSIGVTGPRFDGTTVFTDTMAAFRVLEATAAGPTNTPEPSTVLAGLVACSALFVRRFRR